MRRIIFFLGTVFLIFFTHDLSTFLHEWTHGTVAWLSGYKASPFDIHYPQDWIFLLDVDEAVNYQKIMSDGRPAIVAWIAITPILLGAALFLIGLSMLNYAHVQKRKWLFSFWFWFTLMNLGQVLDYIPVRTFSPGGDIANFVWGSGLSPWMVVVLGVAFVVWGVLRFFNFEVKKAYRILDIQKKAGRYAFLLAALIVLFGYFGGVGFTQPDMVAHILSLISWALIPLLFFFYC